jgi:hypothetical protein
VRFALTLLAIVIGEILGIYAAQLLAEGTSVHLTGRVSAIADEAEEGRFQIIGDSGSLTIDVSAWDYMIDYLRASNGREMTITLEPK